MKRPTDYDQAVAHLKDLRDIADQADRGAAFDARLHQLRSRHAGKGSFLRGVHEAHLRRRR